MHCNASSIQFFHNLVTANNRSVVLTNLDISHNAPNVLPYSQMSLFEFQSNYESQSFQSCFFVFSKN